MRSRPFGTPFDAGCRCSCMPDGGPVPIHVQFGYVTPDTLTGADHVTPSSSLYVTNTCKLLRQNGITIRPVRRSCTGAALPITTSSPPQRNALTTHRATTISCCCCCVVTRSRGGGSGGHTSSVALLLLEYSSVSGVQL